MGEPSDKVTGNLFLDHLPAIARERILTASQLVPLVVRVPLYVKGRVVHDVYFPTNGVISNVASMSDGSQVEVGLVGREGLSGVSLALAGATSNSDLYAQITGEAWKIPRTSLLEVVDEAAKYREHFLAYTEAQVSSLSQYSACNRLHTLEERFARWLLMAHDRMSADEVPLTHEFLSLMLGVRRAGVTLAASTFQQAGLIEYQRGRIVIRDRPNLQDTACECYDAVENRFEELMGWSIRKHRIIPLESTGK